MAGLPFDVQGARAAGYSDADIVNELQKSGKVPYDFSGALKAGHSATDILSEVAPQPSGLWDNAKQGFGEALEGVGNTLNKAGFTNAGPAVANYGKSAEPENFVPSPIIDKSGFHASGILPTLARSAPLAAASIAAAGMAPEAAGAAGAIGLGALPSFLSSAGPEIDATGSTGKGLLTAAGESAVGALPVTRFLGGAAPATAVGAKGVGQALARLGVTAADQGVASGASNVVGQVGRTGTVDPIEAANAAAGGVVGGAAFAGARKTLPEILNAKKYSEGSNDPLDVQARTHVANRIVANAGGDADALQGGLLPSGAQARLGAEAVNKTRADIQSELGTAVKSLKVAPDVDTQNAINAAQGGQHLTDAGYDVLTKGLGNDPQASNILNLIRQNEQLDLVGGHEVGGKLIGGISSLPRHLLSGEHIVKSGLVGLMALAGEHAGHVIAFSPATLGAAGGAMLGGRLLDNMTGAQTPAGRFVRNFADGSDVRLPPVQPPQAPTVAPAPVSPTAPMPTAGGSIMTPQAKAMMAMAQLAQKNAPPPAPTGPATPPVASGSPITPQVRAQMDAMANLQKLRQAPAAPVAPPALNPNALPTSITAPAKSIMRGAALAQKMYEGQNPAQIKAATDLMAARRANEKLSASEQPEQAPVAPAPAPSAPAPQVTAPLPQAKGSIITPNVRALMNAQAAAAKLNATPAANGNFKTQEEAIASQFENLHGKALGQRRAQDISGWLKAQGRADEAVPYDKAAALLATPKPTAVSKGNGKVETKTETPAGDEYTIPRSPYAGLEPKAAAQKIWEDASKGGKFVGSKEGFIAGTVRNLSGIRTGAQLVASAVPGTNPGEIAAQFEGVRSQAEAQRHREWLKQQMPQAAGALDKAFSDEVIKNTWKKKGK